MPIDPFRTPNGALAGLMQDLDEENAHPIPFAGQTSPELRFEGGMITLNAAANVTGGGIFAGSLNFEDRAYSYDAMLKIDSADHSKSSDKFAITGTRWGAGIRIMTRVFDIRLFTRGDARGVDPRLAAKLRRMLILLDQGTDPSVLDLPGYRPHRLAGDRAGQWAATVSGNLRLVFEFDGENATNVDLVDYH